MDQTLIPVERLSRDLSKAARTLTDTEARYLINSYYIMQDSRLRSNNQVRALTEAEKPNSVLVWLAEQGATLEGQIKRALDQYTQAHKMGSWMREIHGIGPVLAAGLLAHIDITKAPTVGHIWRFAGLDPTTTWNKGERRPWNADLKTLCWKVGQSFMKFSNDNACYYGHVYRKRKEFETTRNEQNGNTEAAAKGLARVGKTTEAYKYYAAGKLPPAQIDARARRYAVKLFLSHLHNVWYEKHFGVPAPLPYPIAILGHDRSHYIPPPEVVL